MKLLSSFASKDKQQEELSRKLIRSQEVERLATESNARLARAEADFADALAKSKERWSIEVESYQKTLSDLELEVRALENRKQQALIPISMYKEEVDKTMREAQEIVTRAKEKEEQADYVSDKLENKLTEVADREITVTNEEKRLQVAKQGLQSQQQTTREGVQMLSEQMVLFHEKQVAEDTRINKFNKEIQIKEINLTARVEKYERDLEALKIWDRQLKDKEETLARAMSRLKK